MAVTSAPDNLQVLTLGLSLVFRALSLAHSQKAATMPSQQFKVEANKSHGPLATQTSKSAGQEKLPI